MDPRITLDIPGRCVVRRLKKTSLTKREFELISRLLTGETVSAETLAQEVFYGATVSAVRFTIHMLRKKLEGPEAYPVMIRCIWGKGYRLSLENMDVQH